MIDLDSELAATIDRVLAGVRKIVRDELAAALAGRAHGDAPEPIADVADALGVSPKTLKRRIKDNKLAAIKVGSQFRVKRSDAIVALGETNVDSEALARRLMRGGR